MNRSKKAALVTLAAMVGLIIGLIIASNFNSMNTSIASNSATAPELVLASQNESEVAAAAPVMLDLEAASKTYVEIAKKVSPSVVMITSERVVKYRNPFFQFFGDDWSRRFFDMPEEGEQTQHGLGSGVIVSSDGYILTNNHVIKDADQLHVAFNGDEYEAEVVGSDENTDLAVIKIAKNNLHSVELGDSDALQVGEIVLAIGSPFAEELENTVTQGIVSAKGRKNLRIGGSQMTYQDFIQTDAAINPGNSGGALVNLRGELVGINTAIVGQTYTGVGFAIPINMAKWVMGQLIDKGKVVRGWLGVGIVPVNKKMAKAFGLENAQGALVEEVFEGPAKDAGVEVGDVIVKFDDKPIKDNFALINMVAKYNPGSRVKLAVVREGEIKYLTVKLGERPDNPALAQKSDTGKENTLGFRIAEFTDTFKQRFGYNADEEGKVVVVNVKSGSQAAREGLRAGDIIIKLNNKDIESVQQFNQDVSRAKAGDVLLLRVKNKDGRRFVALEIPE
ncbi:Do family serine endopeptidase [candidate division KSB1 bacterium]|nr:Do family serine endopeptidase [candidate division KSB1 bacterium]